MCVPGKGKTPLRRCGNVAVAVTVSMDNTKAQDSKTNCEKSCQVTSEQIKADMKAATESSSKGISTGAGENSSRQGAETGIRQGTGNAGAGGRTGMRQRSGSGRIGAGVERVGEARAAQGAGYGRVVAGAIHRATTTNGGATGTGLNYGGSENPSGVRPEAAGTREVGARQSTGTNGGVGSMEPRGAVGDLASRRGILLVGQNERQPGPPGSHYAIGSSLQQGRGVEEGFVPRRPLTRSCTRMSSVPLAPEAGKSDISNDHRTLVCFRKLFQICFLDYILAHVFDHQFSFQVCNKHCILCDIKAVYI